MSLDVNISEPDEFNCNILHDCIKNVVELKEIGEFTYHVEIVSGKGANYIANVFRVLIEETNTENRLSVIVKTLVNTTRQEIFRELHRREVIAYTDVIDRFVDLQNDIPIVNRVVLPKSIFLSASENNEVLVLEDMTLSGFTIISKESNPNHDNMNYAQVRLVITELAKFHGLSFVLEKKKDYKDLKNSFEDIIFNEQFLDKSMLRNYFVDSFQASLNIIDNNEVKNNLEMQKDNIIELLRTYVKPRKYNVFCHGDCWINNILLNEEDGERKICFLDFQAMRYASPVTDILYFIYICTDSAFRSKYFTDLKIDYYESLKSFLHLFQIDVEVVYPKNAFDNDLNEMQAYGLLVALLELKLVVLTPDEVTVENTDSLEEIENLPRDEELFRMSLNDVIDESIENGVLNQLYSDLGAIK